LLGLAINFASTYQTENPQEFTKWREQAITYSHLNIFSGKEEPFAPDYFKGLWSRFKKRSKLLEKYQTLYSFRHTGAIDVYKRTGSLEKLKAAMGHSNIMVSLTYLRGLDVAELKEKDMPIL
jgi:integrase